MRSRQTLLDLFSTFLQFASDRPSGWLTDARLRRSMQTRIEKTPDAASSELFWATYWHKSWRQQPNSLAESHLSAYLQEPCYWATQKIVNRLSQPAGTLADYFQMAIVELPKILKACDPDQRASLKTYSTIAFGNIIRDALRQQREMDMCSDWALLLRLSRKRLKAALQQAGLLPDAIDRLLLVWSCYEASYVQNKAPGQSQPAANTWRQVAELYNSQRAAADPEASPAQVEAWLMDCARRARAYLYPAVTSLNAPKPGQEGELQEDLPDTTEPLLTHLIAQEDLQERQTQQSQVGQVLKTAIAQLEPQAALILEHYYAQGLTQQQIAKQLGMQQYTVSRRLSKTRESLLLTLARWSQETLHISLNSTVIQSISAVLEEWLQEHYQHPGDRPS